MKCYITNPMSGSIYPSELNKDNTLFYPESRMTFDEQLNSGRPDEYHIVTDSPFLVGLYSDEDVYYWKDGQWVNPNFQTYGCSYNMIMSRLFACKYSIPRAVLDGEITNIMGYNIKK